MARVLVAAFALLCLTKINGEIGHGKPPTLFPGVERSASDNAGELDAEVIIENQKINSGDIWIYPPPSNLYG